MLGPSSCDFGLFYEILEKLFFLQINLYNVDELTKWFSASDTLRVFRNAASNAQDGPDCSSSALDPKFMSMFVVPVMEYHNYKPSIYKHMHTCIGLYDNL